MQDNNRNSIKKIYYYIAIHILIYVNYGLVTLKTHHLPINMLKQNKC